MKGRVCPVAVALVAALMIVLGPRVLRAEESLLYDFEEDTAAGAWKVAKLPEVKEDALPVRIELTDERVTSGKHALKLTFEGGKWSAVVTSSIPVAGDWSQYQTLTADITVDRECVVGFRVTQRDSAQDAADSKRSRWYKTFFLLPGTNRVEALIHDRGNAVNARYGDVATFTIMMYQPKKDESIVVDNLRLASERPEPPSTSLFSPHSLGGFSTSVKREWLRTKKLPVFKVAGTDIEVAEVRDMGKRFADQWIAHPGQTVEQTDKEFRTLYEKLKAAHPAAVLAVFRDGQAGYDPAHPEAVYDGWRDTHISSHGPDGPNDWRERSDGKRPGVEAFMRHRSLLAKTDLSTIPKGSNILAARLVLVRGSATDLKPPEKANMWIAEPCNRPWDEIEANCYEYAKGRYWKAHSGAYYGEDPDFLPVFLTYGPAQGGASTWDFTEAVKFWTSGEHANHGFLFHGDSNDRMTVHTREAKEVENRPAIMVIYEPKD